MSGNARRIRPPLASLTPGVIPSDPGLVTLALPPELEAKLAHLAAQTGRGVDRVAIDPPASSMDHVEWFGGEVEKSSAPSKSAPRL